MTTVPSPLQPVRSIPGEKQLCFEEEESSAWLHERLEQSALERYQPCPRLAGKE